MRVFALIPWIPSLLWCVLFLSTIIGTELLIPNSRISSDFHLNFYGAGYLVAHNQVGTIYPPSDATSFINTPFDQFLHQFYPGLSKDLYGTFLYTPLVALLFAIFAPFPANVALLVFQTLNLGCIAWLGLKAERAFGLDARKIFLGGLFFFPISGTLWLGQVSMLFGLFPLMVGYFLLGKKRDLYAGFIWSLMSLKPQFLPVPILIALATGKFRCLGALIAGCAMLLALNVFCLTPAVFFQWFFDTTRLANALFTNNVSHLVACVPGTLITCLPENAPPVSRLLIFGAAGAVSTLAMIFVLLRVRKNAAPQDRLALATIVVLITLPVYSRLFNYDLALLAFAVLLLLSKQWASQTQKTMRQFSIAIWIGLNLQFVIAASGNHSVSPLITGLMLTAFCFWGCLIAIKVDNKQAPVSLEQTLP